MKLYITRDEDSDDIWLWLKPKKGNWKPESIYDDFVNFQRQAMNEINTYCSYTAKNFKKKFGSTIRKKTVKCVHLPDDLVMDNELTDSPLIFM